MGYTIHPIMSPGKLARLIELEANSRAPRRNNAGCYCMRLGWVEWLYEIDGAEITKSEMDRKYTHDEMAELWTRDAIKNVGEVLTDAGRVALAAARADQ